MKTTTEINYIHQLYIGQSINGVDYEVPINRIYTIIDNYYKGYTIIKGCGVWEGRHENSIIVTIVDTKFYLPDEMME